MLAQACGHLDPLKSVNFVSSVIVSKHHGEGSEEKGFFVQEDHGGRKTVTADNIESSISYCEESDLIKHYTALPVLGGTL